MAQNTPFDKYPVEFMELMKEAFRNLNIPMNPALAKKEQVPELIFMAHLTEAIHAALGMDIQVERRREIMAEIILLDKKISELANSKAEEIANTMLKSQFN